MTKYEYIKNIATVEEMAEFIIREVEITEKAKKELNEIGVDTNDHEAWVKGMKKYLLKGVME